MCKKSGETVDLFTPLLDCQCLMEFYFLSFWVKVGYALSSGGSLCMLERAI
jgi:hypothetical protein